MRILKKKLSYIRIDSNIIRSNSHSDLAVLYHRLLVLSSNKRASSLHPSPVRRGWSPKARRVRSIENSEDQLFFPCVCYTKDMRFPFINRRLSPLFPIGFITFLSLIAIILFIPPSFRFVTPLFSFSILSVAFPLVFVLFFAIGTLLFKTRMHGFLLSSFVTSYLLLRLNDLNHPIFFVLLAAFFIALEFFFALPGKKHHRRKETAKE